MEPCEGARSYSARPPRGVVSGEFADERRPFATGNGPASATAPMMSSLFPAGANLASTGEVILWGYVYNPLRLSRRGIGTHAMVATLKRPPPEAAFFSRRPSYAITLATGLVHETVCWVP
jgi:hypothetical protein